jgi:hypothetical protein
LIEKIMGRGRPECLPNPCPIYIAYISVSLLLTPYSLLPVSQSISSIPDEVLCEAPTFPLLTKNILKEQDKALDKI